MYCHGPAPVIGHFVKNVAANEVFRRDSCAVVEPHTRIWSNGWSEMPFGVFGALLP